MGISSGWMIEAMTGRPKCAYPCGEGFPCGCKIEQYADKLEQQLASNEAELVEVRSERLSFKEQLTAARARIEELEGRSKHDRR